MKARNFILLLAMPLLFVACNDEDLTGYYDELCRFVCANYAVGDTVLFTDADEDTYIFTVTTCSALIYSKNYQEIKKCDCALYADNIVRLYSEEADITVSVSAGLRYLNSWYWWGKIIDAREKMPIHYTNQDPTEDVISIVDSNSKTAVQVTKDKGITMFQTSDGDVYKLK